MIGLAHGTTTPDQADGSLLAWFTATGSPDPADQQAIFAEMREWASRRTGIWDIPLGPIPGSANFGAWRASEVWFTPYA